MLKKSVIGMLLCLMMLVVMGGVVHAQDKTEITYMMWGSPEELAVWQKIVDEFQVANPSIKVNVDVSDWTSYWDKLKTLMAGGTPPDVFAMDAPLYPDYQSRGVLLNLQPYLDKDPKMLDGFYPVTLEAYKKADGYYGLPRDFQTIVLAYNKDMFDAAGVAYPTDKWTMDDLKANAKLLTKDTNSDGVVDQWGFASDLWDMELFWSEAIWSYGGEIINPEATQTLLTEGKARDAWNFIASMALTDKSMPDPLQSADYGGDAFAAGKAAITPIGHWVVPQYSAFTFKWDVAPMPSGPAGRATSVNSAGFVVAKDSKNPDAAFEFIKYATSAAGQSKLAELGFAIPVLQSVAESPSYLEQKTAPIDHKVFLDALAYAKPKPSFRGYDEWSTLVGDTMTNIWTGDADLSETLDSIKTDADKILAKSQS